MARVGGEYVPGRWFNFDYTLTTDDTGAKHGHMGHQLDVGLDHDLKDWGGIGANVWLEWFDLAHKGDDLRDTGDLDEVDYSAYYRYEIKPLATAVQAGWIARTFPQTRGDACWTHEWFVRLAFNDAKWFGMDTPVLNPYVAWYQDVKENPGGWLEWGISHPFPLAQSGLDKTAFLKDVTITPSYVMGVDFRQQTDGTRIAETRYGLEAGYDLSAALKLPAKYGAVNLTGFLYFCDAFVSPFKDVLYGGVTISFGF